MSTFDRIADLPLTVDGYDLAFAEQHVSSGFLRKTTTITIHGGGESGIGEDISYDTEDHDAAEAAGTYLQLAGSWTLASFCDHVEALDLFPQPPLREVSRAYRIWAYESAALDLALRQAGTSLHERLGITPRPVRFVCSLRLADPGEPPTIEPVRRRLETYPTLEFKLDPTPDWSAGLIAELQATGAVESVDLKGLYEGTVVDAPADPAFYSLIAEAFPDAWIEDPKLTPETDAALVAHRDRITWDANMHAVADIDALPFPPKVVNVKPSRFGPLRELFRVYDSCAEREIGMYGGGQFELGCGRGQIQYLASLFHPEGPNDVAPTGYNEPDPPSGLPASPLAVAVSATGFRWG